MEQRQVGKTRDAGWQIGVSRTVHVDLDTAWDFLISQPGIAIWLGSGVEPPLRVGDGYVTDAGVRGEVRSVRERDRVRMTWQPPDRSKAATLQVALRQAATGCTFRFHAERLADSDERERMRSHLKAIAGRLEEELVGRDEA